MNILFCSPVKGGRGNYPTHVYEVLTGLSKLGHNIVLLGQNQLESSGDIGPVEQSTIRKRDRVFKRFKGEITILGIFLSEIRTFISLFGMLIKQRGKIDIIYRRHGLFHSEYFLGKQFRIPSVEEVNGLNAEVMEVTKQVDTISLRIFDWIERFNIPKADKIIVVTPTLKELLRDDYHVSEDKIVVIENGANTDLFKPMGIMKARKALNLNQDGNYICFVGSLVHYQGIEHLINCAPLVLKECPNTRFLIIGEGQMKKELAELVDQVGIQDKFIFTGSIPYEQVPLYINASDICVTPKKPLKTGYSPLKFCEYMACEKPVIATRTDGFEILEGDGAGLLTNPENPEEFADAIINLLKDEKLREDMGKNGREYVVKNHSWESVAKKVAEVCESAVREHKDKRR